jgi:hypothetical protein
VVDVLVWIMMKSAVNCNKCCDLQRSGHQSILQRCAGLWESLQVSKLGPKFGPEPLHYSMRIVCQVALKQQLGHWRSWENSDAPSAAEGLLARGTG